jgi:hypothetical protein
MEKNTEQVIAKLTPEQIKKFEQLDKEKKASTLLMEEMIRKLQTNVRNVIDSIDGYWKDICREHGIEPSENLYINPRHHTLCRFVEQDEDTQDDGDDGYTDSVPTKLPDPPLESGFDDPVNN